MKIADSYEEMIEYATDFLDEDGTLFITEYRTALRVLEEIQEINDGTYNLDLTNYDEESDAIVYIKNVGDDINIIKNVFNDEGEIESTIGTDYVLIENGLLLKEVVDEFIYANEEISYVDYASEIKDKENTESEREYDSDEELNLISNAIKAIEYLKAEYGITGIRISECDEKDDCDCETCSVSDSCDDEELEDEEKSNDVECSDYDCDDKVCRKCMGYGEDLKEDDTYDDEDNEIEDEDKDTDYEINSIIDEIYHVMKDNDFSEDVIKFILGEFLKQE